VHVGVKALMPIFVRAIPKRRGAIGKIRVNWSINKNIWLAFQNNPDWKQEYFLAGTHSLDFIWYRCHMGRREQRAFCYSLPATEMPGQNGA